MSDPFAASDLALFDPLKQHDAHAFRVVSRRYPRPLCGLAALITTSMVVGCQLFVGRTLTY
jgi:hypothetical protein